MIQNIIIYYLIGIVVSLYNIWFYRFSKWKSLPKPTDAIGSLIGVWLWPLQIILHLIDRSK